VRGIASAASIIIAAPATAQQTGADGAGYGYINGAIADTELEEEGDAIASRLALLDREAIARTKSYVDQVTLPPDNQLPAALVDFFKAFKRPGTLAWAARLEQLGLNVDSDLERHLGRRVVESAS
jgi:hypothetical protein